jgi:hypothetical protein
MNDKIDKPPFQSLGKLPRPSKSDDIQLTEEEKAAVRAEAHAKIVADKKRELKKKYLEELLLEQKRKDDPQLYAMEQILIDLPGGADRLTIDGAVYFHGATPTVTSVVAASIREMMARGWKHEGEIGGSYRDHYRKPSPIITPSNPTGLRASF